MPRKEQLHKTVSRLKFRRGKGHPFSTVIRTLGVQRSKPVKLARRSRRAQRKGRR